MDTIALFNTKGGVGKSAVAVFLCDFLSSQHDKRVLLVDLDHTVSSRQEPPNQH
jgi:cellulose biosynthesis protein BcsQ